MLHLRAFRVTVVWTLLLLLLGSVVHATESSLACPDWPTCFGTMVPEMSGGVFWEHLHRLVAGGLVLMFGLATWLARKETTARPGVYRLCLVGMALLVVQSVFGGLTVLFRLPDLVSTTHLSLAFIFLGLATYLAGTTAPRPAARLTTALQDRGVGLAWVAGGGVFVQSVTGALVRHMDAGMACPDVPFCLGQVVPPLVNAPITVHFVHRVLAIVVATGVVTLTVWARRVDMPRELSRWYDLAAALVIVQVGLGVASVLTVLSVPPVSLHTLVAAALLATLIYAATLTSRVQQPELRPADAPVSV